MKYRPEIDGLRALAVMPVIFFHAGFEWFKGGFVGVDVFFVISGYLITTIIINEMAEGKFSIVNFYERRARRILPALFFVMAVCIPPALLLLSPSDLKDFGESLISTSTFSSNILFWWERGYFGTALELKPLLHTWSLAVEEQYYILFPLFLMMTWRLGLKKITFLLILIFILSLAVAHYASVYGVYNRVITGSFYLIPTRAWELLLGVFAAFYLNNPGFKKLPHYLNQVLSLLGVCMVVFSVIFFDENTPFPSLYTLVPTLGTLLLILTAVPNTFVFNVLSWRAFVFLGLLSYSAYLWHQPIFSFARHKFSNDLSDITFFILSIFSILFAYISWKWIESPFRDKKRISRRNIFNFSGIGIIAFIFIGTTFSYTDGFIRNYNKIDQTVYKEFIDLGKFNSINMSEVNLKEFNENDDRKKLLVIGDSYAEDLVNAIKESKLDEQYQLATYRIPANCGVLYIEKERLEKFQPESCSSRPNFFNNPKIIDFIKDADEVWVQSSWLGWHLDFLSESLERIKVFNNQITVFGSKEFDIKNASEYKNQYGFKRLQKEFQISNNQKFLRSNIQSISDELQIKYIDPMQLICGSDLFCTHSYDGKGIISVDGGHLTKYGAIHFGKQLDTYLDINK